MSENHSSARDTHKQAYFWRSLKKVLWKSFVASAVPFTVDSSLFSSAFDGVWVEAGCCSAFARFFFAVLDSGCAGGLLVAVADMVDGGHSNYEKESGTIED